VERNITDIVANYFRALERREGGTDNRFPTGEPQAFASRTQSGTSTTTPDTEPVSANGEGSDGLPF